MDGNEMTKEIRKIDNQNKCRIILLSADEPTEEFKAKALFDEILVKPMKISKLDEMSQWIFTQNQAIRIDYKKEHKISFELMSVYLKRISIKSNSETEESKTKKQTFNKINDI